jgi:transposase-like protein
MSKKRTTYSSAFKTKLVLELLQNADTLAEIASKQTIKSHIVILPKINTQ